MNNKLKRALDGLGRLLGTFLARQTGAKLVPMELVTAQGVVYDVEDPNIGCYDVGNLEGHAYKNSGAFCIALMEHAPEAGLEVGKDVCVVVDTGLGLVAVRATVREKVKDDG